MSSLHYVDGDYADPTTFQELKAQLDKVGAKAPAHYLAIPPSLFGKVIESLGIVGRRDDARVIVEKPFGRDLASAIELNRIIHTVFPEERGLPDRPLPREGRGPEHPLLPVRQLVPRADLEPQLHLERPDHDGRGLRRAGPGRVLRGGRRACATSCRTTCSRWSRCSPWSRPRAWATRRCATRRSGSSPRSTSSSRRTSCAASSRATATSPGSRRTRTSRRTRRCACTSTRGAGRACRGSCVRARSCPST